MAMMSMALIALLDMIMKIAVNMSMAVAMAWNSTRQGEHD